MTDSRLDDWIARIDRERLTDVALSRGEWHGYTQGTAIEHGSAPMRGEFYLVRWRQPTIAVSHDDPDEVIRLAVVVERALAAEPSSAEALAYAHAVKISQPPMTPEQVERFRREWEQIDHSQPPTVLVDPPAYTETPSDAERRFHKADPPEPAETEPDY